MDETREKIRERVLEEIPAGVEINDDELMEIIEREIEQAAKDCYIRLEKKKEIRHLIFNSIRKMDVLQDILEDEEITEIMVNGPDHIFVEREGKLRETGMKFEHQGRLEDIAQQIASEGNRIVNESNPILDARLADGSRVNIVVPPIAIEGPVITIRKFPKEAMTMKKLIQMGAVTEEVEEFLRKLVEAKYNIFISGGTGAGKTTFLNILSNFIPHNERVITIEDSAELQIQNIDNLVRLEARNANVEGKNEVTIRDLVKSALRMRPDRIIVGEIRDAAAIDLLTAMNTGHDGSLSTGHANSPADMLNRLETLVLMGMDIPLAAIRQQIASGIDLVVHLGRLRDKSRKVLEVTEVGGVSEGKIRLFPLYVFEESGEKDGRVLGELKATGQKLRAVDKCRRAGVEVAGMENREGRLV
ncbi:MAG: CpaF family protein [Lachnospiraceae bacterium]|nr:CpaF family protein [Lachnospiraceae bacterium]